MNEQMSYVARFYSFGSLFLVEQKDQELFTPGICFTRYQGPMKGRSVASCVSR